MIRYSIQQLATRHIGTVASIIAKPAAAVLAGKISSGSLPFSTKPQRLDDELLQKTFTDAFDESDSLEAGKQGQQEQKIQKAASTLGRGRARYHGPLFPSLLAGFDDHLFARGDPFAHPFFNARREPFFDSFMPVLKNFSANSGATLLRSSPGYEIKESDGAYEIVIAIPEGIQSSDMEVELEHDGTVLHVSGSRKVEEEGKVSTTRFNKRFTIGHNVATDKLTANLSEGVLVLKAPKIEKALEAEMPKQTIAITDNPHELSKDE